MTAQMRQWLDVHLKKLNLVDDMNQKDGFTRLGYSEKERESMEVFRSIAEKMGLHVRRDEAGNYIARWSVDAESEIDNVPAVAVGSHVDTVVNGGGYDGVAGVLCALGAGKVLKEEGFTPSSPIEIICFVSEEAARFGVSTIGSKAMSGNLRKDAIDSIRDENGINIKEAVTKRGLNWEKIMDAARSEYSLKSFMELHIEQGTRIEDAGAHFGVVRAVASPIRLEVKVQGKMGHTGSTPMGARQDAMVAVSPLINFISETAERLSQENDAPLMATASTVQVKPNAMNVIPGQVEIGIDIRSIDDALKESMEAFIQEKCIHLEQMFNVDISIETLVNDSSTFLDVQMMDHLKQIGASFGYKSLVMESGAGHDVMNMATRWPSGLIFIPCWEGLSHHPQEYASLEDLEMGVEMIINHLRAETSE